MINFGQIVAIVSYAMSHEAGGSTQLGVWWSPIRLPVPLPLPRPHAAPEINIALVLIEVLFVAGIAGFVLFRRCRKA